MSAAQAITHPFLDKDFMNAFVAAVIKTHFVTANTELDAGKAEILTEYKNHGDIVGFLAIFTSGLKCTLSIAYTKKTVIELYHNLFAEDKTDIDQEVSDFVGEMTNQIYGAAKTVLYQKGYKFDMALPTVIHGEFKTKMHKAGKTLSIPFKVKNTNSDVWIDITLEK